VSIAEVFSVAYRSDKIFSEYCALQKENKFSATDNW